jgi:hypothetical protein
LEPGAALLDFLDWLVREGQADRGLMEALAGTGFDLGTANPEAPGMARRLQSNPPVSRSNRAM